jgi:hypothetical protein
MKWRFLLGLACALIFSLPSLSGQTSTTASPNSAPAHLSKKTREELIGAFTSELVYIRTSFPMGKTGLTLKDGVVSPTGQKLQQELSMWGPSVKAGDEARLTAIVIKEDKIRLEINGGPVKKQKWYNHIQVGVGGTSSVSPSDANANPRGSYVDLVFDHYVPELDPPQLKALLHPVFDFDAKTALEAFLDTVPPKVADAIKNHRVLVGMDREMVIYSLGRPPRKIREKDGETEYEDWVYGDPPQDVNFVRFVGDDVVRVETMKVDGTKMVRTEREVDLTPQPSVAKASGEARPANAPTLRRPGEEAPDTQRDLGTNPVVPPAGTDTPPSTHPLQGFTQAQSLPPTWLAQDGPLH